MNRDDLCIQFDERGLVPAVVQDVATGRVLMVAWMNEEALLRTQETGQAHFWSRSRQQLWRKGATSGHVMKVRDIQVDCDADTLLLQVEAAGPACHTGNRSCFFRHLGKPVDSPTRPGVGESDVLHTLFSTILERKAAFRPDSYTARLLTAGEDEILKKIGEEAMEVILAAKGQGDERVIAEVADLLYHLLVLLASRSLTLNDVEAELVERRR